MVVRFEWRNDEVYVSVTSNGYEQNELLHRDYVMMCFNVLQQHTCQVNVYFMQWHLIHNLKYQNYQISHPQYL